MVTTSTTGARTSTTDTTAAPETPSTTPRVAAMDGSQATQEAEDSPIQTPFNFHLSNNNNSSHNFQESLQLGRLLEVEELQALPQQRQPWHQVNN